MHSHNRALDLRENYRGPDLLLFYRDLRDSQNRKRKILVKTWSTVQDIKNIIASKTQVPPQSQRLYYGPLISLPNHRTLNDAGIHKHGETLLLEIIQDQVLSPGSEADLRMTNSLSELTPRTLQQIIQRARRGLALGFKPKLVLDGSGGTYFLHDARKVKIAVFKPADEEPYAKNNPRGYVGEGTLRAGVAPGQACLREVAAYLLDHGSFASVPMTTLAEGRHAAFHVNGTLLNVSQGGASLGTHSLTTLTSQSAFEKKVGSLQAFVKAECSMDDLSPSMIHKYQIHKIAILDIRLMNADRNSANLLCKRRPEDGSIELIPIDHGFCLRSVCDVSWMDWCWLDWPQLKEPISPGIKDYIMNIDIDADCCALKETLNIQGRELDYFRASNKVLKEGIKSGLSLYDIATICCRNDDLGEVPSKLEMLTEMATELATSAFGNGRWHHSAASKAIADQLSSQYEAWSQASHGHVIKSESSVDISLLNKQSEEFPTMTQSSLSDASSDVGDAVIEQEACEEWAAAIVADVSLEKKLQEAQKPLCDEESEDSASSVLSSSPNGFWFTRPGEYDVDDDDDTINWTPHVSPRAQKEITSDEISGVAPLMSFHDAIGECFLLSPACRNIESPSVHSVSGGPKGGMSRSKSFAAFTSVSALSEKASTQNSTSMELEDNLIIWKEYFSKFVDLAITQETTASAVRS
mmetsp:Transcript_7590/g.8667  ORF Transcript_7590/g.8667 Transcript_7590/m.8667 type:complete len:695 (-) Transcript_7590:279-2363(-)|eukprot:CAMPEP_0194131256 /NCGR_PEP_ID=MMETSP0152-20130528/2064_1 /TAXON_ID=1049557 /ORGANISM="Thalassiothrix antarctica, Strain L6-D1" /LENGTH=694 /DNA_ID=CAMNT_0038825985 /DNA_START=498 /DNA_END=2582 /DNA_ORIENTATION=-